MASLNLLALAVAAFASLLGLAVLRRQVHPPAEGRQVRVFGAHSPVLTWFANPTTPPLGRWFERSLRLADGWRWDFLLELAFIGLWSAWVGRNLLDPNPHVTPAGREFGIQVYGSYFWRQVSTCGVCALWNGMINGGGPFLADPFTGALHPLVAVTTLLWGVANGAKVTVVASLWMAGVAQWWIAARLGWGRAARVWTGLAAASGGQVVGRMELGSVPLTLSTAASSLALAASLDLALAPRRKAALRLAVLLALALLAGHGYMQVGLLAWLPAVCLVGAGSRARLRGIAKKLALAVAIAVLLAGIFLVPFLHFWPQADKFTDTSFEAAQPLEYIPLNLLVHDWGFYNSDTLGREPYPYLYDLFIGWPAVILCIVGLAIARKEDRRVLYGLFAGVATMLVLASGFPFKQLAPAFPFLAGFRHTPLFAGLAVPGILAIAGYGLERVLALPGPRLTAGLRQERTDRTISVSAWWILILPLAVELVASDQFAQSFLDTVDRTAAYDSVSAMKTESLEWVSLPFGEHYWVEAGLAAGLKLTRVVAPWWWRGLEPPPPRLEVARQAPPSSTMETAGHVEALPIYSYPSEEYAYEETASGRVPCTARGVGGNLEVSCMGEGGQLAIRENSWPGWRAYVNGAAAPLEAGRWILLSVPPGPVRVSLRYRPADALAGAILTLMGVILTIALWIRPGEIPEPTP